MAPTKNGLKQCVKSPAIQAEIVNFKRELVEINVRIADTERRLPFFFKMDPDRALDLYVEIEKVKKRVRKLDQRIAALER